MEPARQAMPIQERPATRAALVLQATQADLASQLAAAAEVVVALRGFHSTPALPATPVAIPPARARRAMAEYIRAVLPTLELVVQAVVREIAAEAAHLVIQTQLATPMPAWRITEMLGPRGQTEPRVTILPSALF
jgi:hypothetical protein